MSKKIILKTISILCVIFLVISLFNVVRAETVGNSAVKSFSGSSSAKGSTTVTKIIATVLDIVRTIGASVAVVILLVIAGKYILASAGDRADIKKYAFNYVVGAVILIAASSILTIIRDTVNESLGSGSGG